MKPRLALRAAAIVFAAMATTACGKINIGSYLNIDQSAGTNAISIDLSGTIFGQVQPALTIPLVGGMHGTITVDTSKLLSSPNGIMGTIVGDSINIAGQSQPTIISPTGETGTLCVRQDPSTPTTGSVLIRLDNKSVADFDFAAQATSSLLSLLTPTGVLPLDAVADNVPLQIDFLKLLTFNLNGAIKTAPSIAGTLPATVPFIGGAPYSLQIHMTSSTKPPADALLSDPTCVAFQAGS